MGYVSWLTSHVYSALLLRARRNTMWSQGTARHTFASLFCFCFCASSYIPRARERAHPQNLIYKCTLTMPLPHTRSQIHLNNIKHNIKNALYGSVPRPITSPRVGALKSAQRKMLLICAKIVSSLALVLHLSPLCLSLSKPRTFFFSFFLFYFAFYGCREKKKIICNKCVTSVKRAICGYWSFKREREGRPPEGAFIAVYMWCEENSLRFEYVATLETISSALWRGRRKIRDERRKICFTERCGGKKCIIWSKYI